MIFDKLVLTMKKITLFFAILLLAACASNQSLVQSNKIYVGMSKHQLRQTLLWDSSIGDDAFLTSGFKAYYPDKNMEILAGSNKQIFYVFNNVTIPAGGIGSYGNGTLLSYHWNYQSALNQVFPKNENTIAKNVPSKQPEYRKPENNEAPRGYTGTAFFINNQGYLITNHHVIKDCQNKSKISYSNQDLDVKLIASDANLDLALLKANIKNNNYLRVSNKNPEKLQRIIAVGYPLGKRLSDDLKVTSGIISSVKGYNDNSNQIQIDASLNQGNSGGPIVDEKTGELIAVAVAGIKTAQIDSINFGVKSEAVLSFLKSNKIDKLINPTFLSSGSSSVLKRLEESVVFTYCRI